MFGNPQNEPFKLDPIQDAIAAIKRGEVIIVVDDEDRENEGDFIAAAEHITPEIINFMATHGRGLICAPIIESRCDELGLELMVRANTSSHETPFTVSVDLVGHGCTTGISAHDRAKTIKALIDPTIKPEELGKPGHIFPLRAKAGGVLRRAGHTEATIDLARMAGLQPAGALCEIMNPDGTMARLPELMAVAKQFNLKIISIKDLIAHRLQSERLIKEEVTVNMPTKWGNFNLHAYTEVHTGNLHLALTKGHWTENEPVLVRVHSSCLTGDVMHSLRCDCGEQLHLAMQRVEQEGKGVILYMNQGDRKSVV